MKRNTTQRLAIEKAFEDQKRPLKIEEILEYSRQYVENLNQSTIYRNLKSLIKDGFIKKIQHPTLGALFERTGKSHHHHFHCRKCDKAYELPGCALKKDSVAPKGYVVEAHEIFLFGVCPACT